MRNEGCGRTGSADRQLRLCWDRMLTAEHEQLWQEEEISGLTVSPVTLSFTSISSSDEDTDEGIESDLWPTLCPKVLLSHAKVGNSPLKGP